MRIVRIKAVPPHRIYERSLFKPCLAVSDSNGSVWDVDVSHDAPQTRLYNADGENNHVETLLRESGKVLAKFGRNGRQAGEFDRVHNLAVDSRGNIYTTEVDTGKRAQKFVFTGTFPVEE